MTLLPADCAGTSPPWFHVHNYVISTVAAGVAACDFQPWEWTCRSRQRQSLRPTRRVDFEAPIPYLSWIRAGYSRGLWVPRRVLGRRRARHQRRLQLPAFCSTAMWQWMAQEICSSPTEATHPQCILRRHHHRGVQWNPGLHPPEAIRKILQCLGLSSRLPPNCQLPAQRRKPREPW
jgi:hypothetical protein